MGTNKAPILANIYMAKLEALQKEKCKTEVKLKWPILFKRFIDDGFGVMEGTKLDFEHWISEFNLLRQTITIDKFKFGNEVDFMDLFIYKGEEFFVNGKLDISVFQKQENKYMYIPSKSGHLKHTIRNFILGELRRYVRCCTQEFNFLKTKNKFFKRLRLRGYKKLFLLRLFRKVKHSSRNTLLKISPQRCIEGKFYSELKENNIIEDAEQIFHETFSNEFLNLMENVLNSNGDTNSIEVPVNNIVVPIKVCSLIFQIFRHKTFETKQNSFLCLCLSVFSGNQFRQRR